MSARILVVDDVDVNVKVLEAKLTSEYFNVLSANDGLTALKLAQVEHPDLILLDVMMPRMDGFETCKRLKADPRTADLPVVMVTALSEPSDRVRGLEAGADDFLTKPFAVGELLARIRVALRHRGTAVQPAVTRYDSGGLVIDLDAHRVERNDEALHLTPTEFRLAACLVRADGRVVTHRQLLTDVWGAEHVDDVHYLRLYMAQLRAKLEDVPSEPRHLLTETGVGYRLATD